MVILLLGYFLVVNKGLRARYHIGSMGANGMVRVVGGALC